MSSGSPSRRQRLAESMPAGHTSGIQEVACGFPLVFPDAQRQEMLQFDPTLERKLRMAVRGGLVHVGFSFICFVISFGVRRSLLGILLNILYITNCLMGLHGMQHFSLLRVTTYLLLDVLMNISIIIITINDYVTHREPIMLYLYLPTVAVDFCIITRAVPFALALNRVPMRIRYRGGAGTPAGGSLPVECLAEGGRLDASSLPPGRDPARPLEVQMGGADGAARARPHPVGPPPSESVVVLDQSSEESAVTTDVEVAINNREFICPILHTPFIDPVIAADGHTYERKAIVQWIRSKQTSPMTGAPLKNKTLLPNHHLRSMMHALASPSDHLAAEPAG